MTIKRLLIFMSVLLCANLYVATSLYLTTSNAWIWPSAMVIFFFEVMMPVMQRQEETWRKAIPALAPLLWVVRICTLLAFGVFSILFFLTAVRDVILFGLGFFLKPETHALLAVNSTRFELGFMLLIILVGLYQALIGPGIKRVSVPIVGLPKAFDGFRIVQISDLHIGHTIGEKYVRNVLNAVNSLNPDLVAMTGDITDGHPGELRETAKLLSEMRATYGRYFVTGNHEYYWNAPEWIKVHREAGTHVLVNENQVLEKDGEKIAILGVPDVSAHHFVPEHKSDPAKAAYGLPKTMSKILLAHQPVSYKAAYAAGVNLQLSGHTHSGQFFPWNLVIGFFHDYYRGLGRFKEMWIYVNPGTGYWGPPLRAAVSSEITLLTLTPAVN